MGQTNWEVYLGMRKASSFHESSENTEACWFYVRWTDGLLKMIVVIVIVFMLIIVFWCLLIFYNKLTFAIFVPCDWCLWWSQTFFCGSRWAAVGDMEGSLLLELSSRPDNVRIHFGGRVVFHILYWLLGNFQDCIMAWNSGCCQDTWGGIVHWWWQSVGWSTYAICCFIHVNYSIGYWVLNFYPRSGFRFLLGSRKFVVSNVAFNALKMVELKHCI